MDIEAIIRNTVNQMVGHNATYFALAAIGLNVQFGFAGLLNFGQAAFMAAGAYGLAQTVPIFGISPWWGILIALAYSIVLALIMGMPTLRLRADYLAIVTIGVAEIVRLTVRSASFKEIFGGSTGMTGYAGPIHNVGVQLGIQPAKRYGWWAFQFTGRELWVISVGWTLVIAVAVFVWALMRSPWGRVLKGIREDEEAVRSLGKNVYWYKMQALMLGGVIGTLAGLQLSWGNAAVVPDAFTRDLTFFVMTALVLGGIAKVTGSIIGPMLYWGLFAFLDSTLRQLVTKPVRIGGFKVIASSEIGTLVYMIMGLLLVTLMTFRPQGLLGNRKEMAFDAH